MTTIINKSTERLRIIARAAIVTAKGDMDTAVERFDKAMVSEDDAALERALCAAYRTTAIRALLATHFHELRAEGKVRRPGAEVQISTSDYGQFTERQRSWSSDRVKRIEVRVEERRRNYLNDFRVNGEPIGDCTSEVVLVAADRRDHEARFMRLMASGVPPQGKIRDYVTPEEAEDRWARAEAPPPETGSAVWSSRLGFRASLRRMSTPWH